MGTSQRTFIECVIECIKDSILLQPSSTNELANASNHGRYDDDMQTHPQKKVCFQCHIYFTSQREECISAGVTCVRVECRDQEVQVKCIAYSSLMTATLHLLTEEINDYHTIS